MKKFHCKFIGRLIGSIGATHSTVAMIEMPEDATEYAIRMKLYDKYEHIQNLNILNHETVRSMAQYSLHCGDVEITRVSYEAEIPQALNKEEQEDIKALAKNTQAYKDFNDLSGDAMTIKLCYTC